MRQLLIFVKYPRAGAVKTRLAATLGEEAASDVHRMSAELTLERVQRFQSIARVCVDPPDAMTQARDWLGRHWTLRPQQGATLGDRLAHATAEAFADGARQVVVIGTDSPWITSDTIESAFAALARADVVLGPTLDGGYYLIGLAKSEPALFDGIPWSSPKVCDRTAAKARDRGLMVRLLAAGYDIDYVEDLERFIADGSHGDAASPLVRQLQLLSQHRRMA